MLLPQAIAENKYSLKQNTVIKKVTELHNKFCKFYCYTWIQHFSYSDLQNSGVLLQFKLNIGTSPLSNKFSSENWYWYQELKSKQSSGLCLHL